ncbi:MAG: hypothetical protein H0V92_06275 [Pseudonocardiales bacterium]|nr:hypothetical protein [Pseudonocardiales bacterium]
MDAAATRWQQDDQGLWEVRGPARPYLHSKLMCWVALDRASHWLISFAPARTTSRSGPIPARSCGHRSSTTAGARKPAPTRSTTAATISTPLPC